MAKMELTTIQIDEETDRMLKAVCAAYERSKPAQVRFWVKREYTELERLKLLPSEETDKTALKTIVE